MKMHPKKLFDVICNICNQSVMWDIMVMDVNRTVLNTVPNHVTM